jgi:hypothetical protein
MELKPIIPLFPAFLALVTAFTSTQPGDLWQVTGHLKGRAIHYTIHVTPIEHPVPIVVGRGSDKPVCQEGADGLDVLKLGRNC